MEHYRHIPVWENVRRSNQLVAFYEHVVTYFDGTEADWQGNVVSNGDPRVAMARREINMMSKEIGRIVQAAGVSVSLDWTPPALVGGRTQTIHLIDNIFNLNSFEIGPSWVFDTLERAIGVYVADRSAAKRRTLNPVWWAGRFLVWFGRMPFRFLAAAGFNVRAAEQSVLGRLVRGALMMIPIAAAAITVLDRLKLLNVFGAS